MFPCVIGVCFLMVTAGAADFDVDAAAAVGDDAAAAVGDDAGCCCW